MFAELRSAFAAGAPGTVRSHKDLRFAAAVMNNSGIGSGKNCAESRLLFFCVNYVKRTFATIPAALLTVPSFAIELQNAKSLAICVQIIECLFLANTREAQEFFACKK